MRRCLRFLPFLSLLLVCISACTEPTRIEPEPAQEATSTDFGEDPYAIGSSWYDYDGRTHVLTPKAEVYVVRAVDGRVALVEVAGYYGEKGESGVFSLRAREGDGGAWGEARGLQLSQNVKDAPVCVALGPAREVSCEGADASLAFRTEWRSLPQAGFSVNNPAIYAVRGASVAIVAAESLEDVAESPSAAAEMEEEPSVDVDPGLARVGWVFRAGELTDARTHVQVTSSLVLAKWSLSSMQMDGELRVGLQVECQDIDLAEQPDFSGTPTSIMLSSPMPGASSTTLVRLCDEAATPAPAVVDWREGGFPGTWPDTTTFDLMLVRRGEDIAVLLAPGHLVRSFEDPAEIDSTTIWDEDDP
ncbi:MAG: hypothetical protein AAGI01_04885 [Myxococcota bacterium]